MKKIFLILFLILTLSIPAFAKQNQEPDWMPIMTAQDGTEWYYDLNSLKKSNNYNSIIVITKSYNKNTKTTKKYKNIVCFGDYYRMTPLKSFDPFGQIGEAFGTNVKKVEKGHVSEYLHNEFCKGK